jgi:uncharacterized protein YlbG (UPF0298 family)
LNEKTRKINLASRKIKMAKVMVDTEKVEALAKKLQDSEFKAKFQGNPVAVLKAEGFEITPEMEKHLASKQMVGNGVAPVVVWW